MGMTAILAKIWNSMARRRRQRLALAELMRMAPCRRDELGIDLVVLREALADGRDRECRSPRKAVKAPSPAGFAVDLSPEGRGERVLGL